MTHSASQAYPVMRLKMLCKLKGGAGFPHDEQGNTSAPLPFYKVKDLVESDARGFLNSTDNYVDQQTARRLGAFVFPRHSVLIAKVGAALLLHRFARAGGPCCIDNNMMGLLPDLQRVDPHFLHYGMATVRFNDVVSPGAVPSLNADAVGSKVLPLPPMATQKAIVDFLDRKTAAIDTLIEKKLELLDLLAEKRSALLHDAIHLPECQWVRLGAIVDQVRRPVRRMSDKEYRPIGLYNRGRGLFRKEPTVGADLGDSDFYWVESGDLVLSGQFAWEGSVALAADEDAGCVATHRYPILRGKVGRIDTAYLLAFFRTKTGDFLLNENSRGAAGRNRPLNAGMLLKEKIPVPPLSVQTEIAALVYSEQRLRRSVQKYTKRLAEYRQALITAAVTGQLAIPEEVA